MAPTLSLEVIATSRCNYSANYITNPPTKGNETMLFIDSYCLHTQQFTGRFTSYKNTLLERIYGCEFLTGHPDCGNTRTFNTPTPLFIVDCSRSIKFHKEQANKITQAMASLTNDRAVSLYLNSKSDIDRHRLAAATTPDSPLSKYLELEVQLDVLGTQDDYIQQLLEQMDRDGIGKVVFASSSRKEGKVFAFNDPDKWVDLLGQKAISHGNNLVSGNACYPSTHHGIKVLIVDDDDTTLMQRYHLGDCHGVIKSDLTGSTTKNNPFQYRAFSLHERWIFKGVLRPSPLYNSPYDIIVPLSSFKVDSNLIGKPLSCQEHTIPTLYLAVHKPAKSSSSSFGLNAQYFKTDRSVAALKRRVNEEMDSFNELIVNGRFDLKSIAPIIYGELDNVDDESPTVEGTEADITMYERLYQIIVTDEFGLLSDHPQVIGTVSKWFSSKVLNTALRANLTQRYLLATPCSALSTLSHELSDVMGQPSRTIIINDPKVTDTAGLVSRFPIRNRNDIIPFNIINLNDVWLLHEASDNADWFVLLDQYLERLNYVEDDRDILIAEIRSLNMRYTQHTMWISPSDWSLFGGDFDGDYGNVFPRNTLPELYDEAAAMWTRLPDTIKPPKNPLVGSIERLAAKSFANEIGLLSWCSTIYNCLSETVDTSGNRCHLPRRSEQLLADISQQMQFAVDSYKSNNPVDTDALEKWSTECGKLTKVKHHGTTTSHWIRNYKNSTNYIDSKHVLNADIGNDTITQMIRVVNDLFVECVPKPSPLHAFKDLIPATPEALNKYGETINEFITGYAIASNELTERYFDKGQPRDTYEVDGVTYHFSTDDFIEYRNLKQELLDSYTQRWHELLGQATNLYSQQQLEGVLWNLSHAEKAKGKATLAFYLLGDRIVSELKRPRSVSMELVNDSELFKQFIETTNYTFVGRFEPDPTAKGNATALTLSIGNATKQVGHVYPAPARNAGGQRVNKLGNQGFIGSHSTGTVLMRYDRLHVKGELPVQIRYLRQVGKTYRYEITTTINHTNAVVPSESQSVTQ